MNPSKFSFIWRSPLIEGCAIALSLFVFQNSASAQNITLDGTLGGTPGQGIPVTPGGTLGAAFGGQYPNAYVIPEAVGQRIGGNLFHSFGRFNLGSTEAAVFQGVGLQNILARVTGGSPSTIDGLIQTQSTNVSLFFVNPSGIIFGPNAALDIGGVNGRGSFIATTTDALIWGNDPQRKFSATQPGGPASLLTLVGDPSGFLSSQRPGSITVLGTGNLDDGGLEVLPNKRLLLLGGDVQLNGAVLQATGGRIEIGAVSGEGIVGLDLNTTDDVSLQFPEGLERANISLDRSFVVTGSPTADSGDIAFQARNITLTNGTELQAVTSGTGNAGDVLLTATESVSLQSDSYIFSTLEAGGTGQSGNIIIGTPLLTMSGGAQLQTLVRGGANGVAGIIYVNTNGGEVILSGRSATKPFVTAMSSRIAEGATNTFSGGDFAGNVFGALLGQTNKDITGSVFISTGSLTLSDGAFLDSSTFGNSNAGAVIVLADAISIKNGGFMASIVGPNANGAGGGIVIGTSNLSITGVETGLTTSTAGNGDAGLIFVAAKNRILADGLDSGIESKVVPGVNRSGGGIILSSRSLVLKNGAFVSVNNEGTGSAGDIAIFSNAIWLDKGGRISATTASGEGGNIQFRTAALVMTNSSNISTRAGTAQAGGNGGNILINGNGFRFGSDRTFVVSGKPRANSNIIANAFTGRGGNIFINAYKLSDIAQRREIPATNDIDASSEFGFSGSVTVSVLNVDPERGSVALPLSLADASQLIAEGCDTRGKLALGRLVSTGRGGSPPSPMDSLTAEDIVADWVAVDTSAAESLETAQVESSSAERSEASQYNHQKFSQPISQTSEKIVEAQGWMVDADGSVVLIAQAPTAEPQVPWLTPGVCRLPS